MKQIGFILTKKLPVLTGHTERCMSPSHQEEKVRTLHKSQSPLVEDRGSDVGVQTSTVYMV